MTLPKGWALGRVDELAGPNGLVSDGDWVESKDQEPGGDVRLTQLADVGEGRFRNKSFRFMTKSAADRLRCTFLKPGDVLIARMPDPIGRACIFPGLEQPAVTAVDVMIWRTDGGVAEAEWFVRCVNSPEVRILMAAGAGGTTRQRIAGGRIKELVLPLPPKNEQRRIVAKLDALMTRISLTRKELDRVPGLAERLRIAILSRAFTGKAPSKTVRELVQFVTSGSRGWAKYYSDTGPAFIRVGDVRRRDIALDLNDIQSVQPPRGAEGARTGVRGGDVVITITADLGRVGVVPESLGLGFVNQHVALARPRDVGMAPWIGWYLSSDAGQKQMLAKNRGVTKAGLGLDDIRDVLIPVPTPDVRAAMLNEINMAFARADRLEAEAARARALLDRLESAILAKAFRGELVPQDPNDEPASVLLDRIRAERAASPKPKRGRRAAADA